MGEHPTGQPFGLDDGEFGVFGVPGVGHLPVAEEGLAVGGELLHGSTGETELVHSSGAGLGALQHLGKSEPAVDGVDAHQFVHRQVAGGLRIDSSENGFEHNASSLSTGLSATDGNSAT